MQPLVGGSPGPVQAKRLRVYEKPVVAVVGGLIACALFGGIVLALTRNGPAAPAPSSAGGSTTHTVVYQADGDGTKTASYTLESADGGTVQGDIDLPMTNQAGGVGLTFAGFRPGAFVYLSIQNKEGSGAVTCRILVDGKVVSENTSNGAYVIAGCKGSVPR